MGTVVIFSQALPPTSRYIPTDASDAAEVPCATTGEEGWGDGLWEEQANAGEHSQDELWEESARTEEQNQSESWEGCREKEEGFREQAKAASEGRWVSVGQWRDLADG
jgi:hypothetical protein